MYHVTLIHTKSYSSPLLNVCVIDYISFSCKIAIFGRWPHAPPPPHFKPISRTPPPPGGCVPQFGNHCSMTTMCAPQRVMNPLTYPMVLPSTLVSSHSPTMVCSVSGASKVAFMPTNTGQGYPVFTCLIHTCS